MSLRGRSRLTARRRAQAPVFAALGDATRLSLLAKLCRGRPSSISQLTKGSRLTRQAITKHLRVLESAGIVRTFAPAARTCSNSIPRRLTRSGTTLISSPPNGIGRWPG